MKLSLRHLLPALPVLLGSMLVSTATGARLQASSTGAHMQIAPDAGCLQGKDGYTCNWSSFRTAFDRAHTATVDISPRDRTALHQTAELIRSLGKSEVPGTKPADLTFLLAPVEPTGVNLGPADHDLATLRIYASPTAAPQGDNPHGTLLWVETLRGQGDRPWPAQVHALVAQFQARFTKQS